MTGLGVLGDVRPADTFDQETVLLARPGSEAPSTLATSGRQPSTPDHGELIKQAASFALDRAKRAADDNPTSTTVAALAQSYAALEERDNAIQAAHRAIELAMGAEGRDGAVFDAISLRLAAEVLLRFGERLAAYAAIRRAPRTRPLRIMFASLASEEGDAELALAELDGMTDPLAEALRGYVLASIEKYQEAIGHLRAALREQPDDPDSLLNLSISLWRLGARRKAIATALRATRVAPGRKDVSLHYMNLLLEQGETDAVDAEVRSLKSHHVVEGSDLLIIQARSLIERRQLERAIPLLRSAAEAAGAEGDDANRAEVLGNLVALRYETRRITHNEALQRLEKLLEEFANFESVVLQYARFARTADRAPRLKAAVEVVEGQTSPLRRAYLRYQVAYLEGDNEAAAKAASEWFALEPGNSMAAASALVALGIGVERWKDASLVAREALKLFPYDPAIVNNAAYVLAMSGESEEAIELLKPIAGDDFAMNATLGLAHLAAGRINEGMRLYRNAADTAERVDPDWRSLMTAYQALVVRQLGILRSHPAGAIGALALAQFDPPKDWRNRPEFLRLWTVAKRNGYEWPLAL